MKSIYKYLITLATIVIVGIVFYNKVYIPKITYKTTLASMGDIDVKVFDVEHINLGLLNSDEKNKNMKKIKNYFLEENYLKQLQNLFGDN